MTALYSLGQNLASALSTVTIKGKFEWTDSQGNPRPVRNAWVQLWEDDLFNEDDWMVDGKTNDKGEYELTVPYSILVQDESFFAPAGEAYVRLVSMPPDYPFTVTNGSNSQNDIYEYRSPTFSINGPGTYSDPVFSKTFDLNSEMGQALLIHDAIFVGQQYGLAVFEETEQEPLIPPPLLTVRYPLISSSNEDRSYYQDKTIYLQEDEAWDTILHEFGHYLADIDNLYHSFGGSHEVGKSNIYNEIEIAGSTHIRSKFEGVRLAWSEGLATYLSMAIQHVSHGLGIENVSGTELTDPQENLDTIFTENSVLGKNKIDIEINNETLSTLTPKGEGEESSVFRILWDLADGKNESYDEIEVLFNKPGHPQETGHIALYKILDQGFNKFREPLDTLEDIWNYFAYEKSEFLGLGSLPINQKRSTLGKIFEEHNVSPKPVSYPTSDSPMPLFKWEVGNSQLVSAYSELGNDEFKVLIFDQTFQAPLLTVELNQDYQGTWNIDGRNGLVTWTPNEQEWNQLDPGTYYFVVAGRDTLTGIGEGTPHLITPATVTAETSYYWSGAYEFVVQESTQGGNNVVKLPNLSGDINDAIATDSSGQSVSDEFELTVTLSGTGKRDILTGHNGNDSLFGKGGNDKLLGRQGRDRLNGGGGRDYLQGGKGRDILVGSSGDDVLWGGNDQDKDRLKGGRGADTFLFKQLTGQPDMIMDFHPDHDLLDLSVILSKEPYSVYSGFEAFSQFVRLRPLGRHTVVQVDAGGSSRGLNDGNFEAVAILHRTDIDTVHTTNFIF